MPRLQTRPGHQLATVATPDVGGVSVRRHVLDVETEHMVKMLRMVGRRLRAWLYKMPPERQILFRTEAGWMPVLDKDGNPTMAMCIPDAEFRENAEWYSKAMLGILKEQRERAKMAGGHGSPALDDETFERELADLTRQAIREMPEDEFRALLAERAIDVGGADSVSADSEHAPVAGAGPEQAGTSSDDETI